MEHHMKNIFDLAREEQDRLIADYLSDPEKQVYKTKGGPKFDLPENWQEIDTAADDEEE